MNYEIIIPKLATKVDRKFFARGAEEVAKDLLGRTLVRERGNQARFYARLTEVAPWDGSDTMVKETLYAPGTFLVLTRYAKEVFGVATEETGVPSCVTFISAAIGDRQGFREYAEGPGNLAEVLEIEKELDGVPIDFSPIWIGGESVNEDKIHQRKPSKLPAGCKGYFYFK